MRVTISIGIMAHVARAEMAAALELRLRAMGPARVQTYIDDGSLGCWGNARRIWADAGQVGETHRVLIQEDGIPCRDFQAAAAAAIAGRPADIVSFFVVRKALEDAKAAGRHWCPVARYLGGLALAMPVPMAQAFIRWCDTLDARGAMDWGHHDDVRVAEFSKAYGLPVQCTAPSLVQNGGIGKSVMRHSGMSGGRPYLSPWCLGPDEDGAAIKWEDE